MVNIPSFGVVRAGTYYFLLLLVVFSLKFAAIVIILLPVMTTLRSGWGKYPELRKYIVISLVIALVIGAVLFKNLALGTMAFLVSALPVCGFIALKTQKIKRAIT